MRMDRRAGLLGNHAMPALQEFWENINVTTISGSSDSSQKSYTFAVGDTTAPKWSWYSVGNAVRIDKIKQNTIMPLYSVGTLPSLSINTGSTIEDTKITNGATYGCTLMCFTCPNYSEAVADKRLKNIVLQILGSRCEMSADFVGWTPTSVPGDLFIQALSATSSPYGYWSMCTNDAPTTAIKRGDNSGTFAYWNRLSGTWYLTVSGSLYSDLRCGGIYNLSEAE